MNDRPSELQKQQVHIRLCFSTILQVSLSQAQVSATALSVLPLHTHWHGWLLQDQAPDWHVRVDTSMEHKVERGMKTHEWESVASHVVSLFSGFSLHNINQVHKSPRHKSHGIMLAPSRPRSLTYNMFDSPADNHYLQALHNQSGRNWIFYIQNHCATQNARSTLTSWEVTSATYQLALSNWLTPFSLRDVSLSLSTWYWSRP